MEMNPRTWLLLALLTLLAACQHHRRDEPPSPRSVRLLAINDLHGNLEPTRSLTVQQARGSAELIPAGGIVALAARIEQLRSEHPHSLLVASGDLIGASPLMSSLLRDEPVVQALNRMGLRVSSLGNHEFDRGVPELLRVQQGDDGFAGARYSYLAANVFRDDTGERLFPAWKIEEIDGARIAFIGAVLSGAPRLIVSARIAGLRFADEVTHVNAVVPEILAQDVRAIVLLIHEGALPEGPVDPATCGGLRGRVLGIAAQLHPEIDLIVSGHTHMAYACRFQGRWITQAGSYGHWLSSIDLELDPRDGNIVRASAQNHVVEPALVGTDPHYSELVAATRARADDVARQPVARLAVPQITMNIEANGESALGRTIADAQLFAGRAHAPDIACNNPGSVRQHLPSSPGSEAVTYADAYAVQPFGNDLTVLEISGADLVTLLEQQWGASIPRALFSCSAGFSYRFDATRPYGQRIDRDSLRLAGTPINPARRYRLVANAFMAEGGDGLSVLREQARIATLGGDLQALIDYLREHEPLSPPTEPRSIGVLVARP